MTVRRPPVNSSDHRLARARARDRSSPASLVLVLLVDLFLDETQQYADRRASPASASWPRSCPDRHAGASTATTRGRCSAAPTWSTTSPSCSRRCSSSSGYVVLLMATDYIEEGDYYEGEFYFLLLSSLLGMVVMASARDLITIFVALELLSIPAYLLAGWRKRDLKSNEAALKYYLLGVFASAVMLYGMSLVFGVTGTTRARRHRRQRSSGAGELDAARHASASSSSSSASPSRCRRCRSTPGRPTPTRARPRRSPPSCRWRRRPPASSPCSS